MMRLGRCTALVTGASGGIGREVARHLAGHGAGLVLTGRRAARLQAVAPAATTVAGDLRDDGFRSHLERVAIEQGVDLVVNAAGVSGFGHFATLDEADLDAQLELNLALPMRLTRALLPHLLTRQRAMIVYVGSTFARLGFPGFAAYSAAKAGLRGFSESLRRELADTAVAVLHFSPRATRTDFNDARIIALNKRLRTAVDEPSQVAAALVRAMREERSEVQYGWPEKAFVRINQLLPRFVDRALRNKLPAVRSAADIQ